MLILAPTLIAFLVSVTVVLAQSWTSFDVPHADGQDDIPALVSALASGNITSNATIRFAAGTRYNAWSAVKFPVLTNVEIVLEGNVSLPENITAVQEIVGGPNFPGAWFAFSGGSNVTLRGSADPSWGWVDGKGQAWWDAENQTNRPHGFAFKKINGGIIRDMKLWKPVAWCFSTSGSSNVHIFDNTILAKSDTDGFPFNTDGFDAGGTNITLERNHVVNGDDCVTVGSGSRNITARDMLCEGSHGLSIGSLGSGGSIADVQNVLFENIVMIGSLYAARFKSWTGGNGLARNIAWRNITFDSVLFPIYITQNYWDQGSGPRPNATNTNETHIADFLFEDFRGTVDDSGRVEGSCVSDPCWYAVTNATGKEAVILDLYPGTATNILVKDLHATTLSGAPVAVMCNSSMITSDVGFDCVDGSFIPTKAGGM